MGLLMIVWKAVVLCLVLYVGVVMIFFVFNISKKQTLSLFSGFAFYVIYSIFSILAKVKWIWLFFFWVIALSILSTIFVQFNKNHMEKNIR